jgi:hypothetical protein
VRALLVWCLLATLIAGEPLVRMAEKAEGGRRKAEEMPAGVGQGELLRTPDVTAR